MYDLKTLLISQSAPIAVTPAFQLCLGSWKKEKKMDERVKWLGLVGAGVVLGSVSTVCLLNLLPRLVIHLLFVSASLPIFSNSHSFHFLSLKLWEKQNYKLYSLFIPLQLYFSFLGKLNGTFWIVNYKESKTLT